MNNSVSMNQLLDKIREVSFYMDDLRLFLDTHPNCNEAIAEFNKYAAVRSALLDEYKECYGPLTSYCSNIDNDSWLWTCYPWPWEGVC